MFMIEVLLDGWLGTSIWLFTAIDIEEMGEEGTLS